MRSLSGRLGFKRGFLEFLGYVLNLDSGKVYDKIENAYMENPETLYILLAHYSKAESVKHVGKLLRFRDLLGGYAYEEAFLQRAVLPIAETFGGSPKILVKAAEILGGIKCQFGDVSVEIPAFPKVPLIYVLWKGDDELQPSVSIFFDFSANNYLPTEDPAVLAELATLRLTLIAQCER